MPKNNLRAVHHFQLESSAHAMRNAMKTRTWRFAFSFLPHELYEWCENICLMNILRFRFFRQLSRGVEGKQSFHSPPTMRMRVRKCFVQTPDGSNCLQDVIARIYLLFVGRFDSCVMLMLWLAGDPTRLIIPKSNVHDINRHLIKSLRRLLFEIYINNLLALDRRRRISVLKSFFPFDELMAKRSPRRNLNQFDGWEAGLITTACSRAFFPFRRDEESFCARGLTLQLRGLF